MLNLSQREAHDNPEIGRNTSHKNKSEQSGAIE
ncbi:hypothetical protein NCHU2750_58970 (plasmid) [Neorhizobium sp. NCHU2750]|nr:hypothetical protein NCHU2750_58970 [Neorhizobium sp. NCHU2750]